MACVELVIKILQESYNNLKIGCSQRVSDDEMIEAIKNGTPLPKGHGRLIDAKQAEEKLRQAFDEHEDYNSLARYIVRNPNETPTIIEADDNLDVVNAQIDWYKMG